MPGRVRAEDLPPSLRAKLAGGVTRPAPARTPPTTDRHQWFCLTCGLRERYEAAILRHCDTEGHYRYTDLGLGL